MKSTLYRCIPEHRFLAIVALIFAVGAFLFVRFDELKPSSQKKECTCVCHENE